MKKIFSAIALVVYVLVVTVNAQSYQKTDLGIKSKINSIEIEIQFYNSSTVRILKSPEDKTFSSINVRVASKTGGTLQVRLDKADGPIIAKVEIPKSGGWNIVNSSLSDYKHGVHNLIVQLEDNKDVEIDWVSFE
jgi:hypothetical protein